MTILAVLYARVSTDAQVNTPSLSVQEAQARTCAEAVGATVERITIRSTVAGGIEKVTVQWP
jgi:DNA invertase Pin-like site-specific DNA recombinase